MAPRRDVCEAFVEHADLYLKRTAWSSSCRSWFKQGKDDGPLSIWPGSRLLYFDLLAEPRYDDYNIIYTSGNPFAFLGNGFTVREYEDRDLSYYLGTPGNWGALLPSKAVPKTKEEKNGWLSDEVLSSGSVTADGTYTNCVVTNGVRAH